MIMATMTKATLVAPLHDLRAHDGRTFLHTFALDGDENLHEGDHVHVVDDEHPKVEAVIEKITSDGYIILKVVDGY